MLENVSYTKYINTFIQLQGVQFIATKQFAIMFANDQKISEQEAQQIADDFLYIYAPLGELNTLYFTDFNH